MRGSSRATHRGHPSVVALPTSSGPSAGRTTLAARQMSDGSRIRDSAGKAPAGLGGRGRTQGRWCRDLLHDPHRTGRMSTTFLRHSIPRLRARTDRVAPGRRRKAWLARTSGRSGPVEPHSTPLDARSLRDRRAVLPHLALQGAGNKRARSAARWPGGCDPGCALPRLPLRRSRATRVRPRDETDP